MPLRTRADLWKEMPRLRVSRVSRVQQPAAEQCRGIWGRGGIWVVGSSRGRTVFTPSCHSLSLSEGLSLSVPRGPTRYQSCPNSSYRLPSAVLTVLPLLRRQNLAMGGSIRKLVAERLLRPWLRPLRGGTGRDPGGAGHRLLGGRVGVVAAELKFLEQ